MQKVQMVKYEGFHEVYSDECTGVKTTAKGIMGRSTKILKPTGARESGKFPGRVMRI